ncbi:MAG: alanine--glyoxylate aminotransferase family protein [Acidobacteria bacterium]|nr:alanine--glyoxylate aminotransferase family protein [Acidobacteriota bacterium]
MSLIKRRLLTPGPTPVLPEAALAMAAPLLNHRKDDFKRMFRDCVEMLKVVFQTKSDPIILTSSGSGAMEAAVTNLLSPGDKALVVVGGKFGERWEELCRAYCVEVTRLDVDWGSSVNVNDIAARLDRVADVKAVFVQATESSTGAANDIAALGQLVSRYPDTILVVDAITGLGCAPIHTDAWNLDVVIGGSQKAFMLPPGLAFLSVSEKAWARITTNRRPRFYFDLLKEQREQKSGQTSFTPAISLIQGLYAALKYITELGIDNLVAHAATQAAITRAAIQAMGLRLVAVHPANALTAVYNPVGIEGSKLIAELNRQFGLIMSGGQGQLKGKIFRIAHLGYFDFCDTLSTIGCLELVLYQLGYPLSLGAGLQAAQQAYVKRS